MSQPSTKWSCKETSNTVGGDKWMRWFVSSHDMSDISGDTVVTCTRRDDMRAALYHILMMS